MFVHDKKALKKIGTGYFNTIPGKCYAKNENFYGNKKAWIVSLDQNLYFRSPEIHPYSLLVLDCETLEVKKIGFFFFFFFKQEFSFFY